MKKCGRCKEDKELNEFGKDKRAKDGVCWECKECKLKFYTANKERFKLQHAQYQKDNPDIIARIKKKYYNKIKVSKQSVESIL